MQHTILFKILALLKWSAGGSLADEGFLGDELFELLSLKRLGISPHQLLRNQETDLLDESVLRQTLGLAAQSVGAQGHRALVLTHERISFVLLVLNTRLQLGLIQN